MEELKNKKLEIGDGKILEYYEKGFSDTKQIFETINTDNYMNLINNYSKFSKEDLNRLSLTYPKKDNKLWLELKIEDSYLASNLYSWMYSNSKHDNSSGLSVFGCSLQSIMFQKPTGYTDEEKYAVKMLYEKMFGNE